MKKTKHMSLAELKVQLCQKILNTEDADLLEQIRCVLESERATYWDEMPDEIRKSLEISIQELDEGKGIANEEVFRRIREKWDSQ